MPYSVNGFGTSIIGKRGDVGQNSFDAVEWVVAAHLPVVPISCIHTFDWNGINYRSVPIRWSGGLVMRTFFGRWLWIFALAAVIVGIIGFVEISKPNSPSAILFVVALALAGVATLIGVLLALTGKRDKDVRRVLGRVTIGNCDPANFDDDTLDKLGGNPKVAYGTKSFAEAVPNLLEQGSYAQAMWAARLCVALEDAGEGETLTDEVLDHPDVAAALEEVRQEPRRWKKLMLSKEERSNSDDRRRDEDEEEEYERPRRSRRDDEDERPRRHHDDEDRPRRRDEEYDRPRSRRRDEDEDDRPRRRSRRGEDY